MVIFVTKISLIMSSIYRIRPINDYTIDELNNHYLWFSRRSGFKDHNDANIGAFLDNNELIQRAFERIFSPEEIQELRTKMDCTGICCFTGEKPSYKNKSHYPGGDDCICVEYNLERIEFYFLEKYYLPNCISKVYYFDSPVIFEQDGNYHILTQKDKNGCLYESMREIVRTEKNLDKFIKLLLTRIDSKFHYQNEMRIILGGPRIPSFDPNLLGYKISIPENAITKIHLYKDTSRHFYDKLFPNVASLVIQK